MGTNWDDPMFSGGLVSPNVMPTQALAQQATGPGAGMSAPMSTPDGGVSEGAAPPTPSGTYQLVDVPQAPGEAAPSDNVDREILQAAFRQSLMQRGGGGGTQGLTKQQQALYAAASAVPNPDDRELPSPFGDELADIARTEAARRESSAQSAANMRSAAAAREQEALDRGEKARDEAKAVGSEGSMYDRMNTGGKIASVLSLMAGAYGSVRGTPGINMGQQVLTMFANADAERQRRQYAAAKDKADAAATDYGRLRQAGLDDAAAFAETQGRLRHAHAMEAYRLAADPNADAATKMMAFQVGDAIRDETRGMALGMRESAEHAADSRRAALLKAAADAKPRGGGGGRDPLDAALKYIDGQKKLAEIDKMGKAGGDGAIPVPRPGGGVDFVQDKEIGRRVVEAARSTRSIRYHAGEAARILDEHPVAAANPMTREHKIVREHIAAAGEMQQHGRGMGVLRTSDQQLHVGLLDTSNLNPAALAGVLRAASNDAMEDYGSFYGSAVKPGETFRESSPSATPPKR